MTDQNQPEERGKIFSAVKPDEIWDLELQGLRMMKNIGIASDDELTDDMKKVKAFFQSKRFFTNPDNWRNSKGEPKPWEYQPANKCFRKRSWYMSVTDAIKQYRDRDTEVPF